MYELRFRLSLSTDNIVEGEQQSFTVFRDYVLTFDNFREAHLKMGALEDSTEKEVEECAEELARKVEGEGATEQAIATMFSYVLEHVHPWFMNISIDFAINAPALEPYKFDLLDALAPSIQTCMTCGYYADEIAAEYMDEQEEDEEDEEDIWLTSDACSGETLIAKHLLEVAESATGVSRSWFSLSKFKKWAREAPPAQLRAVLTTICNSDMSLSQCYDETDGEFNPKYCDEDTFEDIRTMRLAHKIHNEEIRGWKEFLDYKDVGRAKALFKAAVVLLCMHTRAAKRANHPTRKRSRGEFEECADIIYVQ